MNEPNWLSLEEIVAINEEQVQATGEPFRLANRGLLESAIGGVKSLWFYSGINDAVDLAVDLLLRIARNHAFEQAICVTQLFLNSKNATALQSMSSIAAFLLHPFSGERCVCTDRLD